MLFLRRIVLVIITVFSFSGSTIPADNFNFVYAVGGCRKLDTSTGIYTNGKRSFKLKLKANQLDEIRRKVREINFFEYPDRFDPLLDKYGVLLESSVSFEMSLKIIDGSKTKEVRWIDTTVATARDDPASVRLTELSDMIMKAIVNDPAFKRIPRLELDICF